MGFAKKVEMAGHSGWLIEKTALVLHLNRYGGSSPSPFDSLNLSLAVGDDPRFVAENLSTAARLSSARRLAGLSQVHGTALVCVDDDASFATRKGDSEPEADGLLTSTSGIGLLIRTADCQAVSIIDPVRPAVSNLHCGWRGIAGGLIERAVSEMKRIYSSEPAELVAVIGPSIGACCCQFRHWKRLLPGWMQKFVDSRDHIDLKAASRHLLMACGLAPDRILVSPECTMCNSSYFSYRRDGITGRNGTVALLL
jgi:YfiH family protein